MDVDDRTRAYFQTPAGARAAHRIERAARVAIAFDDRGDGDAQPLHKKYRSELVEGFLIGVGVGFALAGLLWWAFA